MTKTGSLILKDNFELTAVSDPFCDLTATDRIDLLNQPLEYIIPDPHIISEIQFHLKKKNPDLKFQKILPIRHSLSPWQCCFTRFTDQKGAWQYLITLFPESRSESKDITSSLDSLLSSSIFQKTFDNLPFDIIILDPEGRIIIQNEHQEKRWGTARGEHYESNLFGENQIESWKMAFSRALGGHRHIHEFKFSLDGRPYDTIQLVVPIVDSDVVYGILCITIDLSHTSHDTSDILNPNENLEQYILTSGVRTQQQIMKILEKSNLESLGEMAGSLAHEINQPLSIISIGLDTILYKQQTGELTTDFLEEKTSQLFQDIGRIVKLVKHLQIFALKQDSSSVEIVNVNDVVADTLKLMSAQLETHNIHIFLELDESVRTTLGNRYRIEQVLWNVLLNARDALNEKYPLPPHVKEAKRIIIQTRNDNDWIYLEVEDDGAGIPENKINRVFDPFFTSKDPQHGTGLGLAVAYGIIRDMNGKIKISSRIGKYTRVMIQLPHYRIDR